MATPENEAAQPPEENDPDGRPGAWLRFPKFVQALVSGHDITVGELGIYIAILWFKPLDRVSAWASYKQIARISGITSGKRIAAATRHLEEVGALIIAEHGSGFHENGQGIGNKYILPTCGEDGDESFIMLPRFVVRLMTDRDIKRGDLRIYLAIARFVSSDRDDRLVWPSYADISEWSGVSTDNRISESLGRLKAGGALSVVSKGGGRRKDGKGKHSCYDLPLEPRAVQNAQSYAEDPRNPSSDRAVQNAQSYAGGGPNPVQNAPTRNPVQNAPTIKMDNGDVYIPTGDSAGAREPGQLSLEDIAESIGGTAPDFIRRAAARKKIADTGKSRPQQRRTAGAERADDRTGNDDGECGLVVMTANGERRPIEPATVIPFPPTSKDGWYETEVVAPAGYAICS